MLLHALCITEKSNEQKSCDDFQPSMLAVVAAAATGEAARQRADR
jgi:hypothetical protein